MREKRKYSRVNVSFPIECKTLPSRKYSYTVSKDLSLGGVKILANDIIPKDDRLKLSVNLIKNVLNLTARVAWCSKERLSDRYLAGLEFLDLNLAAKKMLADFLNTAANA